MKLGAWLMTLLGPAVGRILVTLGISAVTYVGFDVMFDQVKTRMLSAASGLAGPMMDLFLFAGGGQGLALIVGACLTRLAIWQMQSTSRLLMKAPG